MKKEQKKYGHKTDRRKIDEVAVLKEHGFSDRFPKAVITEAKGVGTARRQKSDRVDLRGLTTVTIDGEDSRDFDDAVTLETASGGYTLFVHIADVAEFVREGSPLDKEALARGTSVYFPKGVYPMLPRELSNGICSLNPGEDRLALTVKIKLSGSGEVLSSEIFESTVKSDYRMTYTEVTAVIDGDKAMLSKYAKIAPMLLEMKRLRDKLDGLRKARGTIDFTSREAKIVLDAAGEVERVELSPYTVSNSIIEEFMILANSVVAERFSKLKLPFVYRAHDKPDETKLAAFIKFARSVGIKFDRRDLSPMAFKKVLDTTSGELQGIVSKVMLRTMQKAVYRTASDGHFGLALKHYCHFTSPIRRYPDLTVHRIIKLWLRGALSEGVIKRYKGMLDAVALRSSERERAAEVAARDIDDCYKAAYMSRHIGDTFEGIISGVTAFGVFAELPNTCEGLIRIENLPKDSYVFQEERYTLKGTKAAFTLGQPIKIEVISAHVYDGKVGFKYAGNDNGRKR